MYLEQELGAARHAAADLERHHCTLGVLAADDAVDDKLVGRSLRDHSSGILRQDTVPLADGERGQFAEFAEAVAEAMSQKRGRSRCRLPAWISSPTADIAFRR